MNELNKEYVKSISNNLVAILSNLYHDVLIERVTEKYKAEELNLARKELDEIISLFKSKITKQCKPKIENCLNYAISKYGEFYFELPINHLPEGQKCLSQEISQILQDTFDTFVTKLIPYNVDLKIFANKKETLIRYEKYSGAIVEIKHEKTIKNKNYVEIEK